MAIVEDSAHAIFTIISASNAATGKLRKGFTQHFQPWYHARVLAEFRPGSADPLIQTMRMRKRVNSFALEFFAQGILHRLGIRTVKQAICSGREARLLPSNFVVKVAGNDLKWNPKSQTGGKIPWDADAVRRGWCLVCEIVPDAASLDYVSRKLITSQSVRTQMLRESAALHAQKDQTLEELTARALGKTCVPADKFFADFKPTEPEIELIKSAMALYGKKYLTICAARIFIGCSSPHFGNVLVTKKGGELISIDHASGYFESEDHLKELFYFIDRSSDVFKVLDGIDSLTEKDIRESVSEIPSHSACSSTAGLADYFCRRLGQWKELHAKSERSILMETDPTLTCSPLAVLGSRIIAETGALWRL